ncbi:conserved Plasmodium protein, unknown function [Plasmodium ovale]|uniref:Uncharacterized protein n=3 Tax=Plasmodium ovale TaxID=36330 RepID=A0A1D3U824_PLAOA|nr:conserved Plasmodium protein, unknown function [Plasmodium ovale]
MLFLAFLFHLSFFYFCYSYSTSNKRHESVFLNLDNKNVYSYDKKNFQNVYKKNRLHYVYPNDSLFKKRLQTYPAPRVKMSVALFKDMNVSNLFPGFKTIFNKKFLFDPLYNSHKDIIIRNMKTIQRIQKGNVVKNIVIFGGSCLTIYAVSRLLLMLRRFFQNQYKMISEQEVKLIGKYENPHIEFKD